MDKMILQEVIECLPEDRTLFYYFKERYALMLLSTYVGEGKTVSELKKGPFASLLNRQSVKALLANGGNWIDRDMLEVLWDDSTMPFVLTVGEWGGGELDWQQTSRSGYNLVLQLNFSNQHQSEYHELVKPDYHGVLNNYGHPVQREGQRGYSRETLAWARIDLDFFNDQALIEEIQSDWLREAAIMGLDARHCMERDDESFPWWNVDGKVADILRYVEQVLSPYQAIWAEAMLAAAIYFIRHELGIGSIYYHTHDTGYKVKRMRYSRPPRSLYSDLPRRFCFKKTGIAPEFLQADKQFRRVYKKVSQPSWYVMQL